MQVGSNYSTRSVIDRINRLLLPHPNRFPLLRSNMLPQLRSFLNYIMWLRPCLIEFLYLVSLRIPGLFYPVRAGVSYHENHSSSMCTSSMLLPLMLSRNILSSLFLHIQSTEILYKAFYIVHNRLLWLSFVIEQIEFCLSVSVYQLLLNEHIDTVHNKLLSPTPSLQPVCEHYTLATKIVNSPYWWSLH